MASPSTLPAPLSGRPPAARRWDVFCRVIDNHGDLGVCWRLAVDLAARGSAVRLWIDDASALAWMAPHGAAGVAVFAWREPFDGVHEAGDVVIEAFGCELPPAHLAAMAARAAGGAPPAWINLEYLSAEPYVERSHALRSPQQHGPGAGLDKWFFYPGFTLRTGGLLRETALLAQRAAFDADAWLHARLDALGDERRISLFCYEQPALAAWLAAWQAERPSRLLATHGAAERQVRAALDAGRAAPPVHFVGPLTQPDYDRLLWACDLNIVRGEDSFVRAQWAGAPFIWHIYPQADGAHHAKLDAFLDLYLAYAPADLSAALRRLWRDWNAGESPSAASPDAAAWRAHALRWRDDLAAQPDLVTRLTAFVAGKSLK